MILGNAEYEWAKPGETVPQRYWDQKQCAHEVNLHALANKTALFHDCMELRGYAYINVSPPSLPPPNTNPIKTLDSVSVPDEYKRVNSLAPEYRNSTNYNAVVKAANEKWDQGMNRYYVIGEINSAINFSKSFNDNQKLLLAKLVKTIVPMTYDDKPMTEIAYSADLACSAET